MGLVGTLSLWGSFGWMGGGPAIEDQEVVRAPSEDRVRVRSEMLQLLSLCWTSFDCAGG